MRALGILRFHFDPQEVVWKGRAAGVEQLREDGNSVQTEKPLPCVSRKRILLNSRGLVE